MQSSVQVGMSVRLSACDTSLVDETSGKGQRELFPPGQSGLLADKKISREGLSWHLLLSKFLTLTQST